MIAQESRDAAARLPRRSGWLTWLAAICVLLFAFGYFVAKPLAERLLQATLNGIGAVITGVSTGLAAILSDVHEAACLRVEQSAEAQAMVGAPITCAPLERTQFVEPGDRDELEFTFEFSGPRGHGEAHVLARATQTGIELLSVDVTGPQEDVTRLLPP